MTRAASGISRIFCQSCRGSGGGFILYVHMNVIGSLAPVLPWQLGCCVRLNRRILLPPFGGVVEWLMAPVLKTGRAQALVGSNPTPSASQMRSADRGIRICQQTLIGGTQELKKRNKAEIS